MTATLTSLLAFAMAPPADGQPNVLVSLMPFVLMIGIFYVLVDNSAQALSTFVKNDLGLQFDLSAYTVFGILLIVLMYLMPMGIVGGVYYLVHNLRGSMRGGQAAEQQAARKQPAAR